MAVAMGSPAPEFSLTDLQGTTYQMSQFNDTPLLLFFFRTDCTWCHVEMPKLAEARRRHKDVAVQVVGIAAGDDLTLIQDYAKQHEIEYPVLFDKNAEVSRAFGLERVPSVVLIGANGTISRVYEGSSEQLSGIVEQTLMAAARGDEPPEYSLIGNGCAA